MSQATNNATPEVTYMPIGDPNGGTTSIQGIRAVSGTDNVYLAGTLSGAEGTTVIGLIYEGPVANDGNSGNWYQYNYPADGVINTSCYGPNNGKDGNIQVVGSYKTTDSVDGKKANGAMGFYYEGPVDGTGNWMTLSPNGGDTRNVYAHSTMGGIVVGCFDGNKDTHGRSFIYDINTREYATFMVEGSFTTSVYGIWYNGGNSYTIAGGYSMSEVGELSQGFLADYDSDTKQVSNITTYNYNNEEHLSVVTHFQGITGDSKVGYNMPVGWSNIHESSKGGAAFANILRNPDGTFGKATWIDIAYPISGKSFTMATSASKNNITGICVDDSSGTAVTFSYIATIEETM